MSSSQYSQSPQKDLPFDPDQNPEEKRQIRRDYRSLHKLVNDSRAKPTPEELEANVNRANVLFDKVKAPQEAILDSGFLLKTSTTSSRYARGLKFGTGTFDVDDFVTRMIVFMGGYKPPENLSSDASDIEEDDNASLDWAKIGRRALTKSRRVPAMGFILGPLSIKPKKRAQNKRRAKFEKDKKDERRPQEIREEDIARSENETTKNVAAVATALDEVERINIFELVVNPESFAQSVENIFYLSFLIRDAKVAFEIDESGAPIVFACHEPTDEDREEGVRKQQLIFEFDMPTWKRAIDVFKITKSHIPTRPQARTRLGNQWYG
ncbi:Non-structural maintenance of chromosomes element 4 [Mycena sanguinolenta]|uniref:Non-structural maintenance of chromosomes element 4 n=1 Tax=Mycena sanguinolenta TaxID=230812 RepID=A0A8H7DJR6_9AGAR|nr:Non-structural maintenance of chromosomes element 4 [Mycena sanguinolenta]